MMVLDLAMKLLVLAEEGSKFLNKDLKTMIQKDFKETVDWMWKRISLLQRETEESFDETGEDDDELRAFMLGKRFAGLFSYLNV